ncbi:MAG: hypothetical protein QXV98_02835 [Thermofilaceae archaeon]
MLVEIFRRAGAPERVLKRVEEVERRFKAGAITAEEAYYSLLGIAFEEAIPLWPRDVGDIRAALGLPRSRPPLSE